MNLITPVPQPHARSRVLKSVRAACGIEAARSWVDHHVRRGSHRVEVARLGVSSKAFATQRGLLGCRAYPQTLEADRGGEYAVSGA